MLKFNFVPKSANNPFQKLEVNLKSLSVTRLIVIFLSIKDYSICFIYVSILYIETHWIKSATIIVEKGVGQ